MDGFLVFEIISGFIVLQRMVELRIAKRNEKWMKNQGAIEFGKKHYRFMVLMHVLFFFCLIAEKVFGNRELSYFWPILLSVFLVTQIMRIWVIISLGRYWNTKIIVLRDANVIKKGPYLYIRHPNYFVVAIELVVVPLLFNCYITACLFTILNGIILMIRIPEEEKALKELTEYEGIFQDCNRFLPKVVKKM
ncbi:isoprenylcysteine carboxyl methyltransferase family protein [Bacillus sp. UNC41MFS5]|uniref:isoprenylcysteine carboxyl methyltransferase family protein n=1 Tax=Bacillus sp. UNC41MFS5 TaxID=1449046 RepID=UPI00047C2187|nr:isoprenylcysteine carboxyl methyltransferase family protein [Bacillus sp. UNC41MFS5]